MGWRSVGTWFGWLLMVAQNEVEYWRDCPTRDYTLNEICASRYDYLVVLLYLKCRSSDLRRCILANSQRPLPRPSKQEHTQPFRLHSQSKPHLGLKSTRSSINIESNPTPKNHILVPISHQASPPCPPFFSHL